jgi:hypothetical protein
VARKTSRKTSKTRTSSPSLKKAASSRKAKTTANTPSVELDAKQVGDEEVTIDRRRGARREEGPSAAKSAAPKLERREKVNRRRQIDPTTCERDYSGEEIEFMNALDDYKRQSGRMFPTCSEVLEVVRTLGYVKLSGGELATSNCVSHSAVSATTKWCAEQADEISEGADDEEGVFESALAD